MLCHYSDLTADESLQSELREMLFNIDVVRTCVGFLIEALSLYIMQT